MGEALELEHVQRADMGPYHCIASNGVPPTVSKRFRVKVLCEFQIALPIHRIIWRMIGFLFFELIYLQFILW